jgi:hypothetical protein
MAISLSEHYGRELDRLAHAMGFTERDFAERMDRLRASYDLTEGFYQAARREEGYDDEEEEA